MSGDEGRQKDGALRLPIIAAVQAAKLRLGENEFPRIRASSIPTGARAEERAEELLVVGGESSAEMGTVYSTWRAPERVEYGRAHAGRSRPRRRLAEVNAVRPDLLKAKDDEGRSSSKGLKTTFEVPRPRRTHDPRLGRRVPTRKIGGQGGVA